jgi:hypothetical protein
MELVTTLPPRYHESGRFEDIEMLRDRLTGRSQLVLAREASTQLEQRLIVTFEKLVHDGPPGWICQSPVQITIH